MTPRSSAVGLALSFPSILLVPMLSLGRPAPTMAQATSAAALFPGTCHRVRLAARMYDARSFGAKGDGKTLDTDAINNAIQAAATAGGGTVHLSAGRYLSFSIRLKSHVTLSIDTGAVLIAADPAKDGGHYDSPEPNPFDLYQDFGHSHWQNSLIWGIDLQDVAIVGLGLIDGHGLTRSGPGARWTPKAGVSDRPVSMGAAAGGASDPEAGQRRMDGLGNKAIALKRCRNVTLKDFSILNGGVACLDIIGKAVGRPVVDLLGGKVRDRVPFAAYLFFKHGGTDDPLGVRTVDPEAISLPDAARQPKPWILPKSSRSAGDVCGVWLYIAQAESGRR